MNRKTQNDSTTTNTGEATMTKTLKIFLAASLLTAAATTSMAGPDTQYSGSFTPDNPAIYDLGLDLVVVFYYDNAEGERLVVTTIAPKDPDSGRPASEHIVTLREGESFQASFAIDDPAVERIDISIRFDENGLPIAANL